VVVECSPPCWSGGGGRTSGGRRGGACSPVYSSRRGRGGGTSGSIRSLGVKVSVGVFPEQDGLSHAFSHG